MSYKTLLLNASYEVISFIPFRKMMNLHVKGKVDVLSTWDERISWNNGNMKYPAVVRLKYYVHWVQRKARFNRRSIFKRDGNQCQYCGEILPVNSLTLDHVLPRAKGGVSSWSNCTTACFPCNSRKGDKTPEQAKMPLLSTPVAPTRNLHGEYKLITPKHKDWLQYLNY